MASGQWPLDFCGGEVAGEDGKGGGGGGEGEGGKGGGGGGEGEAREKSYMDSVAAEVRPRANIARVVAVMAWTLKNNQTTCNVLVMTVSL